MQFSEFLLYEKLAKMIGRHLKGEDIYTYGKPISKVVSNVAKFYELEIDDYMRTTSMTDEDGKTRWLLIATQKTNEKFYVSNIINNNTFVLLLPTAKNNEANSNEYLFSYLRSVIVKMIFPSCHNTLYNLNPIEMLIPIYLIVSVLSTAYSFSGELYDDFIQYLQNDNVVWTDDDIRHVMTTVDKMSNITSADFDTLSYITS